MDGSMLAATLTAWGMLVRCGEVAAMPRAFGWMGGWRSRREMEDEETAARAPPTDIPIFHQCITSHFKLPRHSSFNIINNYLQNTECSNVMILCMDEIKHNERSSYSSSLCLPKRPETFINPTRQLEPIRHQPTSHLPAVPSHTLPVTPHLSH